MLYINLYQDVHSYSNAFLIGILVGKLLIGTIHQLVLEIKYVVMSNDYLLVMVYNTYSTVQTYFIKAKPTVRTRNDENKSLKSHRLLFSNCFMFVLLYLKPLTTIMFLSFTAI